MNNLHQAVKNLAKECQIFNHKLDINNTAIADIKDIGEVLCTRIPQGKKEFILYNNGVDTDCGGFDVDRPFTSKGIYYDSFNKDRNIVCSISKSNLDKMICKLQMLGVI